MGFIKRLYRQGDILQQYFDEHFALDTIVYSLRYRKSLNEYTVDYTVYLYLTEEAQNNE